MLQSATTDALDDAGSSVSGVTIVVPDATNAVAVTLTAGTMSASAISDAGDTNSSLTAVDLNGPATLSHSSITLADGDALAPACAPAQRPGPLGGQGCGTKRYSFSRGCALDAAMASR